jgi:hypothetical protein
MTNITENLNITNEENNLISKEDKLEFFNEIFCKIQNKNYNNPDYLTDFVNFIELYTTNTECEDPDYINISPFHSDDIKNLTILEEFYDITDVYSINYFAYIDPHNHSYINEFNNYLYYDFNECPKKIFSQIFINEFTMYLYENLNLVSTLK